MFLGEDASGAAVFACNIKPYQSATAGLERLKPLVDLRSLALLVTAEIAQMPQPALVDGQASRLPLGPDMLADLGLDQSRVTRMRLPAFAEAAFEHIAHAQFAPDLFHIDCAALVGEGRVAGDHKNRGEA